MEDGINVYCKTKTEDNITRAGKLLFEMIYSLNELVLFDCLWYIGKVLFGVIQSAEGTDFQVVFPRDQFVPPLKPEDHVGAAQC